jgi:hypothetical protein
VKRFALAVLTWLCLTVSVIAVAHSQIYSGNRRFLAGQSSPSVFLGSDLLAWWDADSQYFGPNGGMTDDGGGLISSWRDIVAGYAVTGTTTARPTFSATSFNGGHGLTFNGTANTLALTLAGQFPAAASPSELWALVQQDALPADTTVRNAVGYGNAASLNARDLRRVVATGVNRGRANTGDGASAQSATGTVADLSSRHVLRSQIGATITMLTVDGVETVNLSVIPSTTATRIRIGASSAGTATLFWQGQIAVVFVTKPLSAEKAAAMYSFLLPRRRL